MNPLTLHPRPPGVTITRWLSEELRAAVLSGRLKRGALLPATREFAHANGISRHVVVNVYEQLASEGYLQGKTGRGTQVSDVIPDDFLVKPRQVPKPASGVPPATHPEKHPESYLDGYGPPSRPFRLTEPALADFPLAAWNRIAARVLRSASGASLTGGAWAGSVQLREAIAAYLSASRGVACSASNIAIVSGTQQALDLLARMVIAPGDPVWLEDPCYIGALDAFRLAGARIVAVPVDQDGLDPLRGRKLCDRPKAVYLTPAHQFGLGTTLSLERRFALLRMAAQHGTVLIEDDYDSEFRFSGRPVPAMKSLSGGESVFLVGTFSKVLFPSLRLGYVVVPDQWMEKFLTLRYRSDRYPPTMSQEILARFIEEGLFVRHLRRMRQLYGARRMVLQTEVERYLQGAVQLPEIEAGLSVPGFLVNGMTSREASARAAQQDLEAWPIDRYTLTRTDLNAIMLGFAAFSDRQIRKGIQRLAKALDA